MSSNVIKNVSAEKRPYRGIEVLAGIYTLVILCIFPFVVHDRYFDILPTKYRFYSTATSAVLVFHLSDCQRRGGSGCALIW